MKNFSSGDVKSDSFPQLKALCDDLRAEIISTVTVCGGHLSSNLGVVELTVALHRVFDFSKDKIVFDVGHQCYAHKLLTGRAERFSTLRQRGGLSGFPKRDEGDCYETGHAGTAVSAALGIAKARDLKGGDYNVIALVGDGSFNNGLLYEAFNSIKILQTNVLIVLNDNGMSISPTVGGTHEILDELKEGDAPLEDVNLFERYGLQYRGIYNGNDLEEMVKALTEAKELLKNSSVLLHVTTRKGRGHAFCENAPVITHGISLPTGGKDYSKALGEELCSLAERDDRVIAVTAAMTDSLGLRPFFNAFPERAYDLGICEEHASVLCASLAAEGMKPYYAIYSTFLQRSFDEIIHDVCGQNLPVTFCIDRAGVSGADGETHQGVFDLSYLSFIPNLTIAVPKDIGEFRSMLRASVNFGAPLAIRYPKEGCEGEIKHVEIGEFEVLHSTMSDVVMLAAGERCIRIAQSVLKRCQKEGVDFTLVNARFVKPLDEEYLSGCKASVFITLEDNVLIGGLGDGVRRLLNGKTVKSFGYRDEFIPHGGVDALMDEFGLNEDEIYRCVKEYARG